MHQKQHPNVAYLVAKVEEVTGVFDFYDGDKAVRHLSRSFHDVLDVDSAARSVTFFEYVKLKENKHHFRQVAHCRSGEEIRKNELLQEYSKCTAKEPLLDTLNRAIDFLSSNNQQAAHPLLEKACADCLQHSPETATAEVVEVLSRLADIYYTGKFGHKADHQMALKLLEKQLELDPNNTCALCLLGLIYSEGKDGVTRDLGLAKAWLEKTKKLERDFDAVYRRLGKIALEEGDAKSAKVYLEEAYSIRPTNNEVSLLLAELLSLNKYEGVVQDPMRALKLIRSVLKRDPENKQALTLRLALLNCKG